MPVLNEWVLIATVGFGTIFMLPAVHLTFRIMSAIKAMRKRKPAPKQPPYKTFTIPTKKD